MAKYLYRLQHTQAGLEGTVKEGFRKREAFFRKTVGDLGGTTETAYWAYDDEDIFIVTDFPEAEAATGLAHSLRCSGMGGAPGVRGPFASSQMTNPPLRSPSGGRP